MPQEYLINNWMVIILRNNLKKLKPYVFSNKRTKRLVMFLRQCLFPLRKRDLYILWTLEPKPKLCLYIEAGINLSIPKTWVIIKMLMGQAEPSVSWVTIWVYLLCTLHSLTGNMRLCILTISGRDLYIRCWSMKSRVFELRVEKMFNLWYFFF